jgi:hypothetical protein
MSYSNAESTLITILAGVSGLSVAAVSGGDYSILDKGLAKAAVAYPGKFNSPEDDGRIIEVTYTVIFDLFVRFTTQTDTHTAFKTLRDAVVARLQSYYRRGNLVDNPYDFRVTSIAAENDPQDIQMQGKPSSSPVFRAQTISVNLSEYVSIY